MCMSIPKELCEVYNCAKVQVSVQSDSSRWLSLQIALYPASSNESNVIGNWKEMSLSNLQSMRLITREAVICECKECRTNLWSCRTDERSVSELDSTEPKIHFSLCVSKTQSVYAFYICTKSFKRNKCWHIYFWIVPSFGCFRNSVLEEPTMMTVYVPEALITRIMQTKTRGVPNAARFLEVPASCSLFTCSELRSTPFVIWSRHTDQILEPSRGTTKKLVSHTIGTQVFGIRVLTKLSNLFFRHSIHFRPSREPLGLVLFCIWSHNKTPNHTDWLICLTTKVLHWQFKKRGSLQLDKKKQTGSKCNRKSSPDSRGVSTRSYGWVRQGFENGSTRRQQCGCLKLTNLVLRSIFHFQCWSLHAVKALL